MDHSACLKASKEFKLAAQELRALLDIPIEDKTELSIQDKAWIKLKRDQLAKVLDCNDDVIKDWIETLNGIIN